MQISDLLTRIQHQLRKLLHWQQYACVRQHNEEDCGAAALATVCRSHGHGIPLAMARHHVGTSSQGTTLLGV